MIEKCILESNNVYFLSLMSQHIRKGDVDDLYSDFGHTLSKLFDKKQDTSNSLNLSIFLFYFLELCKNGVRLDKLRIEKILNKCKDEKCCQMLNQYIEKEYQE